MKKYLNTLLLASLFTTVIHAETLVDKKIYDEEFAKMNQYFNSMIDSNFNSVKLHNFNYPRMDVKDADKKITIKFDLAGVKKKNIKLTIDDKNILTLKGEKRETKDEKSQNTVKKEIFYGSFERAIQLPQNIEQDKLKTDYENGILTIEIPKKEMKKPKARVINIQ